MSKFDPQEEFNPSDDSQRHSEELKKKIAKKLADLEKELKKL